MTVRFLLVDDHLPSQNAFDEMINNHLSWQVIGKAQDGEQAIRNARRLRPDVILMDVAMPEVNGIQAAKRIKEHLPEIRIILYTAYNTQFISQRALMSGADAFFDKSELDQTALKELLERWFPS
ncbi:MAG: response regulator transcription factor [Chloroflexi bacterium]|nr:response regulator transcription factor [Chloroflexota bacterium]